MIKQLCYIARDGTIFTTEETCLAHEARESMRDTLNGFHFNNGLFSESELADYLLERVILKPIDEPATLPHPQ